MVTDFLPQIQATKKAISEKKKENSELQENHRKSEEIYNSKLSQINSDIAQFEQRRNRLIKHQYDDEKREKLISFGLKSEDAELIDCALIAKEASNVFDPEPADALVKLDQAYRLDENPNATSSVVIAAHHAEAKKQPEENRDTNIQIHKSNELLEDSHHMNSPTSTSAQNRKQKVFISHASKDVAAVEKIVQLLELIGFNKHTLFCSSIQPYGIPTSLDIYEYLKTQFHDFDAHVIFVLSNNYYDSVACLNEMGAAWVLSCSKTVMLLPGFSFHNIEGAINPNDIAIQFKPSMTPNELYNLKDRINGFINDMIKLCNSDATVREVNRDDFINQMNAYTDTTS